MNNAVTVKDKTNVNILSNKMHIHTLVILALMFGIGYLPPVGPLTPLGMDILGIFIGCIYGWSVGQMIWPSILALLAVGFTGYAPTGVMLKEAFGNQTLLLVLFSLIFCSAIEKSGLLVVTTQWALSRKFAMKGPWALATAFFVTSMIGSALATNAPPVVILLWSIFYETCKRLGYKPFDAYPSIVLIGICLTGYLGASLPPYGAFAQVVFGALTSITGLVVNYGIHFILVLILNIITIPLLALVFKVCFGSKISYKPIKVVSGEKITLTTHQKIIIGFITLLCVGMMVPALMPAGSAIKVFSTTLSTTGIMVGIVVLMMFITYKGEPLLDMTQAMTKSVPWGMIFLLATALGLSAALTDERTGIAQMLTMIFDPILAGRSPFMFCFILIMAGMVLTNVINNVVTVMLLLPLAIGYMSTININPLALTSLFALVLLQGCVMPSGSVVGAMMHGNNEWLKAKDVYKYSAIGVAIIALVAGLVGVPLGNFLYGLV